jgi:hypothetical protein
MATLVPVGQKVVFTIDKNGQDAQGNPAQVDVVKSVTSSDPTIATVQNLSADSFSGELVRVPGATGLVQLVAECDGRLGPDEALFTAIGEADFLPGDAVTTTLNLSVQPE